MMANIAIICGALISVLTFTQAIEFESLRKVQTRTPASAQSQAVIDLIHRLLPPDKAKDFHIAIDSSIGPEGKDAFQLSSDGTTVSITGTTGVAASWCFYIYLRDFCGCHVSWAGSQLNLPAKWPVVTPPRNNTIPNRYRYYQNVCTVSYTFAFWDWKRWEQEIDWMAMHGINMPLAFNAQETIWQRVYKKMGFTQEELDGHFGGPAFLAWARMGNMRGWGGPLPSSWYTGQLALQHQILQRMRSLGMIPVLPAFAGHVPNAVTRIFPDAKVTRLPDWGHFADQYCCTYFLDPKDPAFQTIGTAFIQAMIEEYNGTEHVYNGDLFNEMKPASSDPAYLAASSGAVYKAISAADKDGVWLMQGWLFQDGDFWRSAQVRAYVQGVPKGKMIILDLQAENRAIYNKTNSFYGQPFIWCMLHNFGGNDGLYGMLDAVNEGPFQAMTYPSSTMIGTGLTPEGILQNEVVYALSTDVSWRNKQVNVSQWLTDYAHQRYHMKSDKINQAWHSLQGSVYNCTDDHKNHNRFEIMVRPKKKHLDPFITPTKDITSNHTTSTKLGIYYKGPFITAQMITKTITDWKSCFVQQQITPKNIHQVLNDYSNSRYRLYSSPELASKLHQAWTLLQQTVYNAKGNHGRPLLVGRPNLIKTPDIWYNWTQVADAWTHMLDAAPDVINMPLFHYDFVDVGRQVLQDISHVFYTDLIAAFHSKDVNGTIEKGKMLTDLLLDMDSLLCTDSNWLLGTWLEQAKSLGTTDQEKKFLEWNARNQLTLWGPNGEILDYANKQWCGLVKDYYYKRWALFVDSLVDALMSHTEFDQDAFNRRCFETVERPWTMQQNLYPTTPTGDTLKISQYLHKKYADVIQSSAKASIKNPSWKKPHKSEPAYPSHLAFQ